MTTPPKRSGNQADADDPVPRTSSPERSRGHSLIERLEERLRCGDDASARAAVRSIVESPLLDEFRTRVDAYDRDHPEARKGEGPVAIPQQEVRDRIGEIPVGVLTRQARAALKCPTGAEFTPSRIVRLSAETALKQLKHSDPGLKRPLTDDHYRLLPEIIEDGWMVATGHRTLEFFHRFSGPMYRVVVKQTGTRHVYLATFHYTEDRHLRGALRRAQERKDPK